jgi:hypothetical protein
MKITTSDTLLSGESDPSEYAFRNLWENEVEFDNFIKLFKDVYYFLEENEASPCICFGTLLGAVRQGGQIPWDGDADEFACQESFLKIKNKFELFLKDKSYEMKADGSHNFKVFRSDSREIEAPFRWPWVDLDFIEDKGSVIDFCYNSGEVFSSHSKGNVFPFKKITYEGMSVSAPQNPEKVLDVWYPGWEKTYQSAKVNCQTARLYGERFSKDI